MSHETIYDAFYLDAKGRLKDLDLQLPTAVRNAGIVVVAAVVKAPIDLLMR
ncbi:hypothetical protein FRC0360_00086 [Corynebacterium diphtheriae]|nr:hypothetical protein FRC0360_00086 [Corynebacterium diphtheriae]